MIPAPNPIAAKFLNALTTRCGAEASLTQPFEKKISFRKIPFASEIAAMLLTLDENLDNTSYMLMDTCYLFNTDPDS